MGVNIETIFDLADDNVNSYEIDDIFSTDLQRYKKFFDEMKIEYRIYKHEKINATTLYIDKNHIYQNSANVIAIRFNEDESFMEFEAWSE